MRNYYQNINMNPKNKKSTDCVVRALTIATNNTIESVIEELTKIYIAKGWFITDIKCVDRFLTNNGFVKQKMLLHDNNKKFNVVEFCDYLDSININKPVVAKVGAGHVAVFVRYPEGYCLVDNHDCSKSCIGNWWMIG